MRKNYFLSLFLLMTAFCNVKATDGSKSTSPTRNIEASVLAPPGNPAGLVGVAVGGNSTRINLNWTDNSTDETEFEVAYSTNLLVWTTTVTGINNNLGTASFPLTGLMPATTYYITVRAIKAFDGTTPTCTYSDPNTPAPGLIVVPVGKTVSCWTNVRIISTNPLLPQPVTGATLTKIEPRSVTLSFMDNSSNELAFEILRSNGGAFVPLAIVQPLLAPVTGVRQYIDNTVLPNNTYKYRVRVFNVTGDAFPSAETIQFNTPYDPPAAPVDLQAFKLGLDFVSFFWINQSPVVDNYDVEFSANGINYIPLTTTPSNITTVTSTGLQEGTQYFYRVRARNNGGVSPYSNVIQPITLRKTVPNAPYLLTAKTISQTQIDLQWTNGTEDGITNNRVAIVIYRSIVSATEGFLPLKMTIEPFNFRFSDTDAKPKTKYWYRIVASNFQGESGISNVVSATTLGPPFAPSNLAVALANDALGNNIIKATWKDNSNDELGFTLERALDSTFTKEVLKANLDSNAVAATSIPIEEGLTYYFRVKASNRFGDSKYSNTSSVATIVTIAPNAPYGLKGTATSEVALKWGDDSNKEAGFEVERSGDGKLYAKIGTTNRNEVAFTDKAVAEKTKYWYRVRATNVKGNSDYSNVVEVTTPAKVSASIDLVVDNVFQVFPNPTSDGVKVTLSENMQKESGVIVITDRMNREVSKTILNENQAEYRLDLSNYSEGTYTISIRTNTQQITKRVYKY